MLIFATNTLIKKNKKASNYLDDLEGFQGTSSLPDISLSYVNCWEVQNYTQTYFRENAFCCDFSPHSSSLFPECLLNSACEFVALIKIFDF